MAKPSSLDKIAAHSRQKIFSLEPAWLMECVPPLKVGKVFLFFFLFKESNMESEERVT